MLPSIANMRLLKGPEFSPFGQIACAINEIVDVFIYLKEDGTHECVIRAPRDAHWLSEVRARRVAWIRSEGRTTEWLINQKIDAIGSAIVEVKCDPLHRILADFGNIEHVTTPGGRPLTNLGGRNGSISNHLSTYTAAQLVRREIDWIILGQNDFPDTQQFEQTLDNTTMLGQVQASAKSVQGVWDLYRNEDDEVYEIRVLEFFGDGVTEFWLTEGRNIFSLARTLDRETLRTVMHPVGLLAKDEVQPAAICDASWIVLAISTDTLTLGRHGYEDDATVGPIKEDGQFAAIMDGATELYPARYLEAPDGTFHLIEDSTSPQTVELESGAGASFAVGDDVRFVADEDGTLLTELASPRGIAGSENVYGSGFVWGSVQLPYHGHRNYVRNPWWRKWGSPVPVVVAGAVDGDHAADTTILLKNLSDSTVAILAGDVLQLGTSFMDRITANVTAVAGAATVTITTARTVANNTTANIWRQTNRSPLYWDRLPADIGHATPMQGTRTAAASLAALAQGAHTSGSNVFTFDGLTDGVVISPGTIIDGGGAGRVWVVQGGTVASTAVTVIGSSGLNLSDNASVTLRVPELGLGSGYVVGQLSSMSTGGSAEAPMLSQDVHYRYQAGVENKLWIRWDMVAMAKDVTTGGWHDVTAGRPRPPALILANSSGVQIVADVPINWQPAAIGEMFEEVLSVGVELTADTDLKARMRWPYWESVGGDDGPWVWCRAIQLHMSMQEDLPWIEGSAATELFQQGQIVLDRHRQWPGIYKATNIELADAFGIEASSPAFDIGSIMRIRSASLGIAYSDNVLLRVVGMRWDPLNPNVKELTLGSAPEFFTEQITRQQKLPYVDVTVAGERKVVLASEAPPADQSGAPRFIVPAGAYVAGAQTVEIHP